MYGVNPYGTSASGTAGSATVARPPVLPLQSVGGRLTLWQLDTTTLGGPVFFFTSAEDFEHQIYWGGQLYSALPMEASGFEVTTRGAIPTPSISLSNLFGAGNLLLDSYKGLVGAEVVRIQTLRRFLDDGETPDPQAYISRDKYVVAQKTSHTAVAIAFKLASRMDVEGTQLPRRQILRDVCTHIYRAWDPVAGAFVYQRASCPYTGTAYFDTRNRPTDAAHDQCSRNLLGCQLRFPGQVLPARFFPGVGKVK
jgi:lambda family phage minor tail protein L